MEGENAIYIWKRVNFIDNLPEKVKGLEADVKPQNGLFEPKASYPFCGFVFNQIPDPLVFLRLWSGA